MKKGITAKKIYAGFYRIFDFKKEIGKLENVSIDEIPEWVAHDMENNLICKGRTKKKCMNEAFGE